MSAVGVSAATATYPARPLVCRPHCCVSARTESAACFPTRCPPALAAAHTGLPDPNASHHSMSSRSISMILGLGLLLRAGIALGEANGKAGRNDQFDQIANEQKSVPIAQGLSTSNLTARGTLIRHMYTVRSTDRTAGGRRSSANARAPPFSSRQQTLRACMHQHQPASFLF